MNIFSGKHALRNILLLALGVRLLAVLFARGYLMHDDHFLTVEPAGSWAAGHNFNDWLPGIGNDRTSPEPVSFLYPGFLFLFFKLFSLAGVDNPEYQMYLMRLVHALYSLLVVYFGFKITENIGTRKQAIRVGLMLALIAILPNFSVRNLVEMACIPPLMAGFYLLTTPRSSNETDAPPRPGAIVFAAILMGLAVGFRYQAVLIAAGVGWVLLWRKFWWQAIAFGLVSFAAFFLSQIDDVLLWGGKPFQHLQGYFEYNQTHAGQYPGSPYTYLSFIGLFILPPVSIFLLAGFFKMYRKQWLIFFPVLLFLLFHIIYPNRQERFILPALPFVVILGIMGWDEILATSKFWIRNEKLNRWSWRVFWSVNILAMLFMCFVYGKKSRVESMIYLYDQPDYRNFIQDFSYSDDGAMLPQFYSGKWTSYYVFRKSTDFDHDIVRFPDYEKISAGKLATRPQPNYVLFVNDDQLEMRVERLRKFFPTLEYRATIEPGWMDKLLNRLNKYNTVERIFIYHIPG